MILVSLGALLIIFTFGLLYAITEDSSDTFFMRLLHGLLIGGMFMGVMAGFIIGLVLIIAGLSS